MNNILYNKIKAMLAVLFSSQAVGGDLSGNLPNPTVAAIDSLKAGSAGQALLAVGDGTYEVGSPGGSSTDYGKKDFQYLSQFPTCTTVIPVDGTVPQKTEGDQVFSAAYTMQDPTAVLIVKCKFRIPTADTNKAFTFALFANDESDSFGFDFQHGFGTGIYRYYFVQGKMAGQEGEITIKCRCGPHASGGTITGAGAAPHALAGEGVIEFYEVSA